LLFRILWYLAPGTGLARRAGWWYFLARIPDEIVVGDGINGESHWGRDGTLYYVGTDRKIVAVTLRLGAQLGVASRVVSETLMNGAAIGWDVDASGKRFVYGSDASNNGGSPRLVVTVNALGRR